MRLKNLVGRRFGLLTVEKREGDKWQCVCECGRRSQHTANNLRYGHSKSCGHLKNRPQRQDLSGRKFSRLQVNLTGHRADKGIMYWHCTCRCGKELLVSTGHLRSGHTRSCGCLLRETARKLAYKNLAGKKRTAPNRTLPPRISGGYRKIHDETHPRAHNKFVWEHIVVMERKLGRQLQKGETIHHKNGDRLDNRPNNLELWFSGHPYGQRVTDLVHYAQVILKMYGGRKHGTGAPVDSGGSV